MSRSVASVPATQIDDHIDGVLHDHASCNVACPGDVVGGAGRRVGPRVASFTRLRLRSTALARGEASPLTPVQRRPRRVRRAEPVARFASILGGLRVQIAKDVLRDARVRRERISSTTGLTGTMPYPIRRTAEDFPIDLSERERHVDRGEMHDRIQLAHRLA